MNFKIWPLLLFTVFIAYGQQVSGIVLNHDTKEPLVGASVYFNNTSIGTSTDLDGAFNLEFPTSLNTPLVVSYVGFRTFYKEDLSNATDMVIELKVSYNSLDEVVLSPYDDWSRELKLKEFKKHYLGESVAGKASVILNEEDLVLTYNSKDKKLKAKSRAPLDIQNDYLKYLVTVDLNFFEANYSSVSKNKKRLNIRTVSYFGSNRFKTMAVKSDSITMQRREQIYFGSTMHFMRALREKKLNEEGFEIFLEDGRKSYKQWIKAKANDRGEVVVSIPKKYTILYRGSKQSSIECLDELFYIDGFGNHSPPERVVFTGDLGGQRMGDMLPFDFEIIKID